MNEIFAKPLFGITLQTGSTLLMWLHLLSPIIAFTGVVIGFGAAIYSFRSKQYEEKLSKLRYEEAKKSTEK